MRLKINLLLTICLLAPALFWAQPSQTFLLQNGFPLKKREAYIQSGDLIYTNFMVGLSDRFSIGAGGLPSFFFDPGFMLYTVSLKYAVPLRMEKVNVALCFFHFGETYLDGPDGGNFWEEWGNHIAVPYGVVTLGSRRKNVSFAGGAYYGEYYSGYSLSAPTDNYFTAPSPYFALSAHLQGKRRWAFLTENHYFRDESDQYFIFSFGGRYAGRGAQLDVGFSLTLDKYMDYVDAYPIPWLGLFFPIGKTARTAWRDAERSTGH